MLKFKKKGLICDYSTLNLPWFKKNTMVPITYLVNSKTLRIFLGMCDADNVGRIGYIDVNPSNPSEILDYSKTPCLDIGKDGCFDDNGALPSGVIEEDGKLYMFYSGYQLMKKVPYLIFSGAAVSENGGTTFTRLSNSPFLDRTDTEFSVRAAVSVERNVTSGYNVLYLGGSNWVNKGGHLMPSYDIRFKNLQAEKVAEVLTGFKDSSVAVSLKDDDEFALAMPKVFIENSIYKMIYSIRSKSKGYRMGYAESYNEGKTWVRKDDQIDLDVSESGWDSEMVCFGHLHTIKDKTYIFYCGNHYGLGGMGYAELIR